MHLCLVFWLVISIAAFQAVFIRGFIRLKGYNSLRSYAPTRSPAVSRIAMAGGQVPMVPYYPDKTRKKEYMWMDIYNALGRDRTLFVGRYLDDEACNQLIASLVWLQGQSDKLPITLYFNVPGAMSKPALAVFDVMSRMHCPLITINTGLTVGVGALLCAAGSSGQRCALPNARFLMSRAGFDDGVEGQASDVALHAKQLHADNDKLIYELAKLCGQPKIKLERDLGRDFYLTAAEAAAYGLIDKVMLPNQPVKMMKYRGSDDSRIGYGHFAEAQKLQTGPDNVLASPSDTDDEDEEDKLERRAAELMAKKGLSGRPDPRSLKNGGGVNRFANSRCKPPGINKPSVPPPPGSGGGRARNGDDNPFKNAF